MTLNGTKNSTDSLKLTFSSYRFSFPGKKKGIIPFLNVIDEKRISVDRPLKKVPWNHYQQLSFGNDDMSMG